MGSTEVARRAGRKQARKAAPRKSRPTARKMRESIGETPKRQAFRSRVVACRCEETKPIPTDVSRPPCISTKRRISRGAAPSAMRMPNSLVRLAVMYAKHAVQSGDSQNKRQQAEDGQDAGEKLLTGVGLCEQLARCLDVEQRQTRIEVPYRGVQRGNSSVRQRFRSEQILRENCHGNAS